MNSKTAVDTAAAQPSQVTDEMVSRFLRWQIPADFKPDFYISFDSQMAERSTGGLWPTGTNLFTATQAREMLEFVLAAATPAAQPSALAALTELVAVKDLKDRTEALSFAGPSGPAGENWQVEYDEAGRKEYIRRQPLAWEAARAVLAATLVAQPSAEPLIPEVAKTLMRAGEPRNSAGETPTEHAHRWATELAVNMHRKFYPEVTQWKPFPDLLGVITQLDNMSCGLVRAGAGEQPSDEQRLNWLEKVRDRFANIDRITSVNGKFNGVETLRAAIDAAMKEQP